MEVYEVRSQIAITGSIESFDSDQIKRALVKSMSRKKLNNVEYDFLSGLFDDLLDELKEEAVKAKEAKGIKDYEKLKEAKELKPLEITIQDHGICVNHDMPCPICRKDSAVMDLSNGVFQPCWGCQRNGWLTVSFKGISKFVKGIIKHILGVK